MANVLVVEPDAKVATAVAQCVREMRHEPRTLASAKVAKQLLGAERISVLIADLRNDGLDLLRTAKLGARGTRVIFVCRDASASEYKRAIQEGALDVLVKPFSREDLQDALRRAFDSSEGTKSIIHKLNLTDLLQIMHMGRRSVTVKLSPGEGRIYMADGQIVHASHDGLTGRTAMKSMLAIEPSSIETAPAADVLPTIDAPFEMLLLDLMRELDEERRYEPEILIEEAVEQAAPPAIVQTMPPALPEPKRRSAVDALVVAMAFLALAIALGEIVRGISEAL